MPFNYEKVIEIADRLEELSIPSPTIRSIKAWAEKEQNGIPLPKKGFHDPIRNFIPKFMYELFFDVCPDCGASQKGYRSDMCPLCKADFTQSVAWRMAYREYKSLATA